MSDRTDRTVATLRTVAEDRTESPPLVEGSTAPEIEHESEDPRLLELLDEIRGFVETYAVFPSPYASSVVALWTVHSWIVDRFDSTPRLGILSAEKGSGKTRILEILEVLVRDPVMASDVSAATLFRIIEKRRPTILLDEADLLFAPGSDGADSVRQIVNAGYRVGNPVLRCVGQNFEPTAFDTFSAVAIAGIGDLPETILDRSVTLRIRRRAKSEKVERWRTAVAVPRGHALRDRIEEWSRESWEPTYPDDDDTITDRLADVWEPLFVLADRAGGSWPELVREAVADLHETTEIETLGLRLLREIRQEWPEEREWWRTSDLVLTLHGIEEGPWCPGGPFGESGLSAHRLARMLHDYRIGSTHNRDRSARGYARHGFLDAWERYLPPVESEPGSPGSVRSVGSVPTVRTEEP